MHMLCANKLGAFGLLVFDAMGEALGELSPSAASLLLTLSYRPGLTVTELAAVAGIAQPTAVRVLDGLVKRGLAERGEKIGRTAPLALTNTGRAEAERLQAARLGVLDGLLGALPDDQRAAFEAALDTILAGATTSRSFARTTCRLCDHELCDGPLCPIGTRATEIERNGNADRT
ncbi:MAG: MarR family transcriptional regulator [Hyphomicrobiales bacterium]|mgnify:CR=1 FL=1|nr:MAG: MarR family transcriptional regulator [Hyphomicrobiales bacterium]